MVREAMNVCLRVLMESTQKWVRQLQCREQSVDHIPDHLRDCRVHIFSYNPSRIAQLSKFTFLVINPRQLTFSASRSMLL